MVLAFLKILYTCAESLYKKYETVDKEKYTSHTIGRLTAFTCAFCHTCVKNLLEGPGEKRLLKPVLIYLYNCNEK